MADKKISIGWSDIALLLLGVLYLVGILTFFAPCGPKADGSWMACHWAGHAVAAFAAVILALAVLHAAVPSAKTKLGLSLAEITAALAAALVPGTAINLCGMKTMRCHTVMHPAVIVASILVIVLALMDIFVQRKKK